MPNNKQIIFGFVGLMASGKGEASTYLKESKGASVYRFSTILRDVLKRLHISEERTNLATMSDVLRNAFGDDLLARVMAEDAKNDTNQIIVIDGIRRLADISHLEKLPNFVLVEIVVDSKVRYERLVARGENTDELKKTYEQFLNDQAISTEITIPPVMAVAKEHVNNNGTTRELHQQLDALLKKYL
jgi:dephospho-CoA kinase